MILTEKNRRKPTRWRTSTSGNIVHLKSLVHWLGFKPEPLWQAVDRLPKVMVTLETFKNTFYMYINVYIIYINNTYKYILIYADPSGRAVLGEELRPIAGWDCGFESRRGNGCLSVVNVVYCQVEVPATGRSLVQRSPIDCGVSLCVI
jgi:hypothetical protein